jgi:hypothetical protein
MLLPFEQQSPINYKDKLSHISKKEQKL